MLRLKLLGGVSLEGPAGFLQGRAAQRRQLSLLAYLAGSRTELLSRDRIAAMLWPESPAGRARQLLSDSLHVLRKALGEDAIQISGADLGIDSGVMWCDVPAFWTAVEAGELCEAVALYEGPFLDGFHVSGAVEFERWVDGERGEVQRVARRSAGELAARAERAGDYTGASRWARRALAIDAYDERAAQDLVRLLAAAGDRAGAIQAYESFAGLFREDLELEVSAETAALIERIRDGDGGVMAAPATGATDRRVESLAVLPLENLSADPEQEYFVAGMQDALIGELARIDGLRVISRTSTLAFKDSGQPVPAIARALNVDAVLEGTVLRAGSRVRIQLQLIRARPTERHLWAEAYDRPIRDVLAVHREVTRAVAREISAQLTAGGEERLARTRRVNPASYEAYLRGNFHLNKFTPEGFRLGLAYLQEAVDEDPSDPLPHAALALGYSQFGHESGNPGELFPQARAAAMRALELDDTLTEALEALAETKLYWDWDWEGAEQGFERALELNPNLALVHAHRGWYLHLRRRWDEGVAAMRHAQELDPLVPLFPAWTAWQLRLMGRHEQALPFARASLELEKDFPVGLYVLGFVYSGLGRYDDAVACHRAAGEASPSWAWGLGHTFALAGRVHEARRVMAEVEARPTPMTPFGLAEIHAALGDTDEAFHWLEIAFDSRFSWVPWIPDYTTFASLTGDARFRRLVHRLRLPDPWSPHPDRR